MFLKEKLEKNPSLLKEADVKSLYKMCSKKVIGSEWESVFFPKPMTADDYKTKKNFKKQSEFVNKKMERYEKFFNEEFFKEGFHLP